MLAACSGGAGRGQFTSLGKSSTTTSSIRDIQVAVTVPPSALPAVLLISYPTLDQCKKIVSPWKKGFRSLVPSDAPPYFCGNRDVLFQGGDIYNAQLALIDALEKSKLEGCDMPYGAPYPDGQFGPATLKAVAVFQDWQGMYPTGALDSDTLELLANLTSLEACPVFDE